VKRAKIFLALLFLVPFLALASETTITAHIEGMTCPACAASVERQFRKLPGVNAVNISLSEGTASVTLRQGMRMSEEEIKKAVEEAGYKLTGIEELPK
jgi:copper chaperone CopZ